MNGLRLISPGHLDSLAALGYSLMRFPDLLEFAGDFLKASSTGVDHLNVVRGEVSQEELTRLLIARYKTQGIEKGLELRAMPLCFYST